MQNNVEIVGVSQLPQGRAEIVFDTGVKCVLYRSEIKQLSFIEQKQIMKVGSFISQELYNRIIKELLALRVKKRAMFLLQQMDRTEKQLYDKLKASDYPEECIAIAMDYVKGYSYIDDERYARNFVRCYQDRRSRGRLKTDLMKKGISNEYIEIALEEEYQADETEQIKELLEKRHFDSSTADQKEKQRIYGFLLRRGFKNGDILKAIR